MFICPYLAYRASSRMRQISSVSYIRFLNASPNSPAIDIYLNERLLSRNLSYKSFSDYTNIPYGTYNIKVFPAGSVENPIVDQNLTIPAEKIFTIAATDHYPNITLLPIEDIRRPKIPNRALIRFVNLTPDSPGLNLVLPGGNTLFSDVSYKEVSPYIPIAPGVHTLEINNSDSNERVLYVPNIRLTPNRFYSIYSVGNLSGSPEIQALIPLDGNSYIRF
ncbi:DUF4397 domain-containing protein [Clostridium luticellarii]|uniref:DUF4397 domain-containing protein n=1 Tax=Clostridium luticellarii TaxID=1691940 RepID=A0A2T0BRK4_9CLOT|nr:DUF4397 domain-containing protein [Clostridium luticellarii]MCI1943785.1 DUF4397 domain-containing protein [Clostridium luticellarii]MCI1967046.1 DUF4397 domain-containing protein [Clostridium luticellarii]MCI1994413.1 DUF4397 domain-containing protein [Clostridium luticellarii]MCI2038634.1 DUF4397 domain-containing protein [Clostridium luticellarii]PRR86508.1 hypothetical protein CLLU_06060 [Clostridium luticellarii]